MNPPQKTTILNSLPLSDPDLEKKKEKLAIKYQAPMTTTLEVVDEVDETVTKQENVPKKDD